MESEDDEQMDLFEAAIRFLKDKQQDASIRFTKEHQANKRASVKKPSQLAPSMRSPVR